MTDMLLMFAPLISILLARQCKPFYPINFQFFSLFFHAMQSYDNIDCNTAIVNVQIMQMIDTNW